MQPQAEHYLGDGLYVSFDGYQYRLRAPRQGGNEEVFLEATVLAAFIAYTQRVSEHYEKLTKAIA